MSWPWKFVDLGDAEKGLRRQTLNRYAGYAQISAFGPVFLVLVYRLAVWAIKTFDARRVVYSEVPMSPIRKKRRQSGLGAWEARYRLFQWWLGDDLVFLGQYWGRRDEWVFGLVWGAWMLALSVLETGHDYLHLTKRLGIIAISQLPLQYLLSLKSLNPIAFALRSSHEEINRFHRALGRIVWFLLLSHATLYLNFFIQKGQLLEKLTGSRPVATGVVAIISMDVLAITAWKVIRTYSYRLFFITHLTVAVMIPPLIWFHAHSARIFVAEALLVFLVDIISRKLDTVTSTASFESMPGTSLVKVTTSVPTHKIGRFRNHPGSHIYMQIPGPSRLSQDPYAKEYLVHEFLFNPFTVAAVDDESGELTLVARHLNGPTTSTLKQLAQQAGSQGTRKTLLAIEGPYGVAAHFPQLAGGEYDRVLLVSGGVGATFTVPLFRALVSENPAVKVQLVWSVRSPRDAAWAKADKDGTLISEHEGVQLFVTGPRAVDGTDAAGAAGVELSTIEGSRELKYPTRRPDLRNTVDEVFRHGQEEKVAVLFCGPSKMGRELRAHVGVWAKKGRDVFWHSETFECIFAIIPASFCPEDENMVKQFITMPALDVTPHNDLENEQPVPKWIRTQKRRPWHLPNPVVSTLIFLLPSFIVNRFRKTTPSRIHPTAYLDGLRGIAALFVYICHYTLCWRHELNAGYGSVPGDNFYFIQLPIIRLVYAGTASVRVFFVISGFVLSIKTLQLIHLEGDQNTPILRTLSGAMFRRPFRLYLPIIFATAIPAILIQLTPEPDGFFHRDLVTGSGPPAHVGSFSQQFEIWTAAVLELIEPFHFSGLHASAVYVHPITNYAGQLWTIPTEFKGSVIVFLLLLAFSRARRWVAGLVVFVVGVVWQFRRLDQDIALFCAGMLLAELGMVLPPGAATRWFAARGFGRAAHLSQHGAATALFVLALFLLSFPEMSPWTAPGFRSLIALTPSMFLGPGVLGLPAGVNMQFYWVSVGSILLIFALMYSPPARMAPRVAHQSLPTAEDEAVSVKLPGPEQEADPSSSSSSSSSPSRDGEPLLQRLFTSRFSQYMGRVSFGLYLTHNLVNHLVGVHWSNPGVYMWGSWYQMQNSGQDGSPEKADFEAQWRRQYWGLLIGGWLVNSIAVFWVADVFTRGVDEPCVRFTRWLSRWVERPKVEVIELELPSKGEVRS